MVGACSPAPLRNTAMRDPTWAGLLHELRLPSGLNTMADDDRPAPASNEAELQVA